MAPQLAVAGFTSAQFIVPLLGRRRAGAPQLAERLARKPFEPAPPSFCIASMKHFIYLLSLFFFVACAGEAPTTEETPTAEEPEAATSSTVPSLSLAWETDTVLTTCESVLYDAGRKQLYVANIEENPWEMDGNGSIAIIDLNGKVVNRYLVKEGLNAPKGMGLKDGKLFAADINAVVEIDIEEGTILARHSVPDAKNLNDITVATDGTLYVSDSGTGKAHRMTADNTFETIVSGVERPNGLLALADGHVLLGDTNGRMLLKVNPADGTKETITEGVEPDGIIPVGDGSYIVSRWGGQVHHIAKDGKATLLLDTEADKLQSADLGYIPEQKLVLVPAFFGNKVMAYRLE
ncbi:MAG: SMP-30/gluconolactonase/LRE family protein [Bacteroidota bacterium]